MNIDTRHVMQTVFGELLLNIILVMISADEISYVIVLGGDPDHDRFKLVHGDIVEELPEAPLELRVLRLEVRDSLNDGDIVRAVLFTLR